MILSRLYQALFCIGSLFSAKAFSQGSVSYIVQRYNDENTLPQSSINGLEMDVNGFLWIATDRGMVRFDGQRFTNYNVAADTLLGETRVVGIKKDQKGIIHSLGLTNHGVMVSRESKLCRDPLPHPLYRSILTRDGRSFLLFPNSETGIPGSDDDWHFDASKKSGFRGYGSIEDSIFYIDSQGCVIPMFSVLGILDPSFYVVGDTMITCGSGILKFTIQGKMSPVNLEIVGDLARGHAGALYINKLRVIQHGRDMLLQYGNDVYLSTLVAGKLQTRLLYKQLTSAGIVCFCYNPYNGGYFLGTATEALYYLRPNLFKTLSNSNNVTLPNAFYALAPLPDNSIYTTMGIRFAQDGRADTIVADYFGSGIHYDKQTNEIFHSSYKHIIRENLLTKTKTYIRTPGMTLKSMARSSDTDPRLWLAGERTINYLLGDSLYLVIPKKSNVVYECIDFKNKENLYLGTYKGLLEYNLFSKRITAVAGLDSTKIRSITKDPIVGAFWIGTEGKGFYYLHEDTLMPMPIGSNGELNTTHIVLTDKNNNTWVTGNNGLFMAPRQSFIDFVQGKRKTVDYNVYNVSDGLPTNEFNGIAHPAGGVLPNGVLAFPSMRGIVLVDPDAVRTDTHQQIFVDSLWIDGAAVVYSDSLTIGADFRSLGLLVSSPSWGNASNEKITWNIPQLSGDWMDIPATKRLDFFKLPAGEYQLVIKKGTSKNSISKSMVIHFTVLPHWYRLPVAIFGFVLLGIGLLSLSIYRYNKALINKKNELEQTVAKRTESLRQTLGDYQHSIEELNQTNALLLAADGIKEQAISIILHDLKSPTFQLARTTRLLAQGAPMLSKEELAADMHQISTSAAEVSNLTESLLQWLLSQKDTFQPVWQSVSLRGFLEDVSKLYRELIKANGNNFGLSLKGEIHLTTDANILSLVIRNLLDNANKNTENSDIRLEGSIQNESVTIKIIDGGRGISQKKMTAINTGETIDADGTGLGFSIIFQFLRILQGQLSAEKNRERGTTMSITLPVRPTTG